jgi:hypothetical protein
MTLIGNYKPEDLAKKPPTLIESLKRLAELFPEKWKMYEDGIYHIDSQHLYSRYIEYVSTEDCDRILAEHGMEMWVIPHGTRLWRGYFDTKTTDALYLGTIETDTKRLATEATFLAALEYIAGEFVTKGEKI